MLLLDVNVLIAAHRDDHRHHALIGPWFQRLLAGNEPFAVTAGVGVSFLRLVTGRRVFDPPTPVAAAFDFLDGTCAQPHHLLLGPGDQHFEILRRLCDDAGAIGELIADAAIAAIALEHGCAVASLDRDFGRFASIRHVVPGS